MAARVPKAPSSPTVPPAREGGVSSTREARAGLQPRVAPRQPERRGGDCQDGRAGALLKVIETTARVLLRAARALEALGGAPSHARLGRNSPAAGMNSAPAAASATGPASSRSRRRRIRRRRARAAREQAAADGDAKMEVEGGGAPATATTTSPSTAPRSVPVRPGPAEAPEDLQMVALSSEGRDRGAKRPGSEECTTTELAAQPTLPPSHASPLNPAASPFGASVSAFAGPLSFQLGHASAQPSLPWEQKKPRDAPRPLGR